MPRMLLNSDEYDGLACEASFSNHQQIEQTFSDVSMKRAYMALPQHNSHQLQGRLDGSAGATTSGRLQATAVPPFSKDIIPTLYSKSVDKDALVRFQTQQLQSGMELLRRKHSRDLMMVVEQQAAKRLNVKEMELEYVSQRNRDLEEQVKQMAAESQFWFNYAKTNEAVVSSLRSKLEMVITAQVSCPAIDVEEGYGDSGGDPFPADDVGGIESSTENQIQRPCRVCRKMEVCVLLLPCRDLCLCKGCESRIETCPVCNSAVNASIKVVVP